MTVETAYEIHALAHLLPTMRAEEFAELKEDIAANGQREAITLYEGKVLDGRHRQRACVELGLIPDYRTYEGDDPAGFVWSLNLTRRHLTQSQRAMMATNFLPHLKKRNEEQRGANLRTAPRDERGWVLPSADSKDSAQESGRAALVAAKDVGVGHAQVVRANKIKREDPELAKKVLDGDITIGAAHKIVTSKSTPPSGDRSRQRPAADMLENLVAKLLGLSNGLEHIDTAAAIAAANGSLVKWDRDLTDIIVPLNRLRGDIRKALSND